MTWVGPWPGINELGYVDGWAGWLVEEVVGQRAFTAPCRCEEGEVEGRCVDAQLASLPRTPLRHDVEVEGWHVDGQACVILKESLHDPCLSSKS